MKGRLYIGLLAPPWLHRAPHPVPKYSYDWYVNLYGTIWVGGGGGGGECGLQYQAGVGRALFWIVFYRILYNTVYFFQGNFTYWAIIVLITTVCVFCLFQQGHFFNKNCFLRVWEHLKIYATHTVPPLSLEKCLQMDQGSLVMLIL